MRYGHRIDEIATASLPTCSTDLGNARQGLSCNRAEGGAANDPADRAGARIEVSPDPAAPDHPCVPSERKPKTENEETPHGGAGSFGPFWGDSDWEGNQSSDAYSGRPAIIPNCIFLWGG